MLLVAGVLALVASAKAEDTKDASKLVGTWTVASAEKDGKAEASTDVKGKQVTITRDTITCTDKDGKTDMVCEYTADTSRTPWQLDLTCTKGENKGKKIKAIASLDGDTLKVCHGKPGDDAPTGFKTAENQCCMVLKRAEK
jgi:uncharacterized protein (TIGR03067 family)